MQLKAKLFKVKTELRKLVITYCFSFVFLIGLFNCFTSSLFGLFVYCVFASNIARRVSPSLISSVFSNVLRKSCVSLTNEGVSLTIGWRWLLAYFERFAVWATRVITGRPGLPFYVFLVVDTISVILGHFFSGPRRHFF